MIVALGVGGNFEDKISKEILERVKERINYIKAS